MDGGPVGAADSAHSPVPAGGRGAWGLRVSGGRHGRRRPDDLAAAASGGSAARPSRRAVGRFAESRGRLLRWRRRPVRGRPPRRRSQARPCGASLFLVDGVAGPEPFGESRLGFGGERQGRGGFGHADGRCDGSGHGRGGGSAGFGDGDGRDGLHLERDEELQDTGGERDADGDADAAPCGAGGRAARRGRRDGEAEGDAGDAGDGGSGAVEVGEGDGDDSERLREAAEGFRGVGGDVLGRRPEGVVGGAGGVAGGDAAVRAAPPGRQAGRRLDAAGGFVVVGGGAGDGASARAQVRRSGAGEEQGRQERLVGRGDGEHGADGFGHCGERRGGVDRGGQRAGPDSPDGFGEGEGRRRSDGAVVPGVSGAGPGAGRNGADLGPAVCDGEQAGVRAFAVLGHAGGAEVPPSGDARAVRGQRGCGQGHCGSVAAEGGSGRESVVGAGGRGRADGFGEGEADGQEDPPLVAAGFGEGEGEGGDGDGGDGLRVGGELHAVDSRWFAERLRDVHADADGGCVRGGRGDGEGEGFGDAGERRAGVGSEVEGRDGDDRGRAGHADGFAGADERFGDGDGDRLRDGHVGGLRGDGDEERVRGAVGVAGVGLRLQGLERGLLVGEGCVLHGGGFGGDDGGGLVPASEGEGEGVAGVGGFGDGFGDRLRFGDDGGLFGEGFRWFDCADGVAGVGLRGERLERGRVLRDGDDLHGLGDGGRDGDGDVRGAAGAVGAERAHGNAR